VVLVTMKDSAKRRLIFMIAGCHRKYGGAEDAEKQHGTVIFFYLTESVLEECYWKPLVVYFEASMLANQ
jgi:hypothetical protein